MKRRIRNLINAVLNEVIHGNAVSVGKQSPETGTSITARKEGDTIKMTLTLRGEDRDDANRD